MQISNFNNFLSKVKYTYISADEPIANVEKYVTCTVRSHSIWNIREIC